MTLLSLALMAPAHAAPVKIVGVEAKSYYSRNGTSYHPDNIKDGKSTPPWFEGDPGNGAGSWIEVDLGGEHNVTRINLLAGDWTSGTDWGRANRPQEIEIRWSDGTTELWSLTDEWKIQSFVPSAPKATSKIRFKVNTLYSGSAFPDAAISEIQVFDDQEGSVAEVKGVTASSEFPADNDGAYYPHQAADGVRDTMWCEGNKESDGVGEWVEFDLGRPTALKGMKICAGMCASIAIHKKGNAPTQGTVMFSDGATQQFTLKDFPLPQNVSFDTPHTTDKVKIRIDTVRKGSEYDDACVSEVTFDRT
ncbi:MAG: discoidin domain-containing protein [Myxococcales bacterium]|nr:discoidin domain-containing protein [Myxococcales bacterium]